MSLPAQGTLRAATSDVLLKVLSSPEWSFQGAVLITPLPTEESAHFGRLQAQPLFLE